MGFDLTTPTETASLINTKPTIEERFHALRQRIVVLEHELHGDPDIGTTGLSGVLQKLLASLDDADKLANTLGDAIMIYERKAAEFERVSAFLAPAMEGATPPLNGQVVVTRAELDGALQRLAGTLRTELTVATAPKRRWWQWGSK